MPSVDVTNPLAQLVNLKLDAVALCDQGANSRAYIVLTKNRKENTNMPFDQIIKSVNEEHAKVITDHIAAIELAKDAKITELQTQIDTLKSEAEELKKSATPQATQEDVLKSASPEIQALVQKLKGDVDSLIADKQEAIAKERFAKVKAIPVEEDTLKSVLKTASPAVIEILEKASSAIEESLLKAKGAEGAATFSASTKDALYATLEKSARKIMEAEEKITFEQAFLKACERDPDTYNKYSKGVK